MIYIIVGRDNFIENSSNLKNEPIEANWLTHYFTFLYSSYEKLISDYSDYLMGKLEKEEDKKNAEKILINAFQFEESEEEYEYGKYSVSKSTLKDDKFPGLKKDLSSVFEELKVNKQKIYVLEKDKVFFVKQPDGILLNEKQSALLLLCILADLKKNNLTLKDKEVIYICHDSHIAEEQIGFHKFSNENCENNSQKDKLENFKDLIKELGAEKKYHNDLIENNVEEKLNEVYSFQHESSDPIYGSLISKGKLKDTSSLSEFLERLLVKEDLILQLIKYVNNRKLGQATEEIFNELQKSLKINILDDTTEKKIKDVKKLSLEEIEKLIAGF